MNATPFACSSSLSWMLDVGPRSIDRCCTHVIRPDGELDSFCRYYAAGGAPA